jgi:hypothetical protein
MLARLPRGDGPVKRAEALQPLHSRIEDEILLEAALAPAELTRLGAGIRAAREQR